MSERFSQAAAFQYYQSIAVSHDFAKFAEYLKKHACPDDSRCSDDLSKLEGATSIDMDFDAISHAVVVNALWAAGPSNRTWPRETIIPYKATDTTEIGILNREKADEPEEVALGGFLTVIGQDEKPG